MVQQLRPEEPQYACVIPIESITGNQDEEIVAFGVSELDAKNKAEQLLVKYQCNDSEIHTLMHLARIEALFPWCSPNSQG